MLRPQIAPKCCQHIACRPKFSPPALSISLTRLQKGPKVEWTYFLGICARLRAGYVGYKRRCYAFWRAGEGMLTDRLNVDQHVAAFAA